jgi:hypothetical protein
MFFCARTLIVDICHVLLRKDIDSSTQKFYSGVVGKYDYKEPKVVFPI